MIITKKHLARRTFLRGLGTAMALPLVSFRPCLFLPDSSPALRVLLSAAAALVAGRRPDQEE